MAPPVDVRDQCRRKRNAAQFPALPFPIDADKLRVKLTRNSITRRVIWSNYGEVSHYSAFYYGRRYAEPPGNYHFAGVISDVIVLLASERIFS